MERMPDFRDFTRLPTATSTIARWTGELRGSVELRRAVTMAMATWTGETIGGVEPEPREALDSLIAAAQGRLDAEGLDIVVKAGDVVPTAGQSAPDGTPVWAFRSTIVAHDFALEPRTT